MTLEAIYYISQIVAVIAILASLIFVGLQVRQSNRAADQSYTLAKAEMTQSALIAATALQREMFSTLEGADLMHRGMFSAAPLTEVEKLLFGINMSSMVSCVEGADILRRQGLMDETSYQRNLMSIALYFESPRVRKWWKLARQDRFIPPFRDVIDEIAQKAEAVQMDAHSEPDGDTET